MSSETTETKPCTNCKKSIAVANFTIHEVQCKRHLVQCNICQVQVPRSGEIQHFNDVHAKIACAQCQVEVEKDQIAEHLKDSCPKRQLHCDYCELQLPQCDLAAHVESCGTRSASCHRCNNVIMHKDLLRHIASDCAFLEARRSADAKSDAMVLAAEEVDDVPVNPDPDEVLNIPRCSSDCPPSQDQTSNQEYPSDDVMIPCEFCKEIFPGWVLVQHQAVCDHDTDIQPMVGQSEANQTQAQTTQARTPPPIPCTECISLPLVPSMDTELLLCELCDELLPADSLLQHQIQTHSDAHFRMLLPCEFCEALLPASSLQEHQAVCEAAAAIPPAPTEWFIPANWVPQSMNENVKRVSLASTDPEYISVADELKRTISRLNLTIIEIARIQNRTLYLQYLAKKTQLQAQNPGIENERTLWHGTAAESIDNINHYGFNRSYCGKHGTARGDGVYFAVDSGYSLGGSYSPPDSTGKRYLYQCDVLVGYSCKGRSRMRVLPERESPILYDSATDHLRRPSMYVIFNDTQAYPSYLITFRSRNGPSPLETPVISHPLASGGL